MALESEASDARVAKLIEKASVKSLPPSLRTPRPEIFEAGARGMGYHRDLEAVEGFWVPWHSGFEPQTAMRLLAGTLPALRASPKCAARS